MMNFKFVSALVRGKWAIDPLFALNSTGLVASIINGTATFPEIQGAQRRQERKEINSATSPGVVAIVPITGALMKEDGMCGEPGMQSIGYTLQALDADHTIKSIILRIDSPGGTVDGTETLASIVKNISKPVLTFVDGLMASAALWIGSSANEVWASTELDEVGSVGVLLQFADMQPYYEAQGVKFHKITSSLSPDKTKWFEDLRSGNYEDYIKESLDPVAERFQEVVKTNRPEVKKEHLTGKVFNARDVLGVFVDRIGTIDQAIERAHEMSRETTVVHNSHKTMNYPLITQHLGEENLEFEADGRRTFTPEEMTALENALTAEREEEAPEDNSEELTELQATITQLEAERDQLTATLAERDEQITNLLASPGAEVRDVVKATDAPAEPLVHDFLSKKDIELYNQIKR